MSNYYEYREVKVMIAHRLMDMDGWKVYGYSPDASDLMVDYHSPAHWGGVAEKNGYVLCVDVYGASDRQEIREYSGKNVTLDPRIFKKLEALREVTVDRGAAVDEERSAKKAINALEKKAGKVADERNQYRVVGYIPAHMAHPPRCNWHIEKDGIIIAKGNGILKFAGLYLKEDYQASSRDAIRENIIETNAGRSWILNEKELEEVVSNRMRELEEVMKLKKGFDSLIHKFDTTCGALLGEGEVEQYEKIVVKKPRKVMKIVEAETGKIQEGQMFVLKVGFNYGRYKGLVYRIHEENYNGKVYYHANKLNGKLTKECHGKANSNNHWSYISEKFLKWIEKGAISWCNLEEETEYYEVEKVVKKTKPAAIKSKKKPVDINKDSGGLEYQIRESTHTATGEKLWLVKIKSSLSKPEFKALKQKYGTIGGYYSSFTKSFVFKQDPTRDLEKIS